MPRLTEIRLNKNQKIPSETRRGRSDASDDEAAAKLAQQHDADPNVCKKLIEIQRQVRKRLGSPGVVRIERIAAHSHPEGGERYIRAVIDGCTDRLDDLEERASKLTECRSEIFRSAGLETLVVADDDH